MQERLRRSSGSSAPGGVSDDVGTHGGGVRVAVAVLALGLGAGCFAGCTVGDGDGWIRGGLWVENCRGGDPFGGGVQEQDDFDLRADFFVGEPIEDSNESLAQRRNSLVVRIQPTSNNLEVSDGIMLQFNDLDLAVRRFVASEPLEITHSGLCSDNSCPNSDDPLRGTLYLYTTCPQLRQPLIVSSHVMTMAPVAASSSELCLRHVDEDGQVPVPAWSPPCPTLSSNDRAELDSICQADFKDQSHLDAIGRLLGDGACLYLCEFGAAKRGEPPDDLGGFFIDYGDRVAAILSMTIVDGRAVTFQSCAEVTGKLRGMFSFEVVRGRAAQSFP